MSSVVKSLSTLQEPPLFEMLSSAFMYRTSFENHSCEFVDIPMLCQHHHRRECTDMMNININVVNRKWNMNCVIIWFLSLCTINLLVPYCYLYCSQKTVFSLHFNVFIYSLTMSQFITSSASAPVSNVLILIQPCCAYCVCQIACLADACNVTDIHWCDYYCLLNKHYWPVSSIQGIRELLMSRRFHSPSMLPPTTFFTSIVTPTIRQ